MRGVVLSILALAIAAAPASVSAQRPGHDRGRMAAGPGPRGAALDHILAQRETLALSTDQVSRIEQIRSELEVKNQPLLEQLRGAMPDSLQPRRERMREGATQSTAEQRAEMRERAREMRERMQAMTPEERAARRAEMRSQRRERADSLTPERREEMRARMRERGDLPATRPRLSEEQMAAVRPLLQQLRENTAQAVREAHALLTEDQRERLREIGPRGGRLRGVEHDQRRSPDGR